jgi:hypothetical protein
MIRDSSDYGMALRLSSSSQDAYPMISYDARPVKLVKQSDHKLLVIVVTSRKYT